MCIHDNVGPVSVTGFCADSETWDGIGAVAGASREQ